MPNKVDGTISNIVYNAYLERMSFGHNQDKNTTSYIGSKRKCDEIATGNPDSGKKARTVSLFPKTTQKQKAIEAIVKKFIISIDSVHDTDNEKKLYSVFQEFYSDIKKYTPLGRNCIEKLTPVLGRIIKNIDNKNLSVDHFYKILYLLSQLNIFDKSCTTISYRNKSKILLNKILGLVPDISEDKNKELVSMLFSLCTIASQDHILLTTQNMNTLLKKVVNKLHINSLDNKSSIKLLSGLSMLIRFNLLTVSDNIKNIINDILEQLTLNLNDTDRRDIRFKRLKICLYYLRKSPDLKPIIDNYLYLLR